ncbi:MAG: hypothetical protein WBQ18_04395 [Solirubrobacteraceae bacterium]
MSRPHRGRALGALSPVLCVALAACGGSAATTSTSRTHRHTASAAHTARRRAARPHIGPPVLLAAATASAPTGFVPVMTVGGATAAWVARTPALTLLSFDQHLVGLHLHSGTIDAGSTGWRWGPTIAGSERRSVVAAFNGAFRLDTGAGGFESYGRVAAPLQPGAGSIVTYSDGTTDIGAWDQGVPAAGRKVVSVRQNLHLLIDAGRAAPTVGCDSCWGATLGGIADPARSGLGITADGHLIWVGGEHVTVTALSDALLSARVVRAVELDINPEWVAGYLYRHGPGAGALTPVQVVAGQPGVPGQFLGPYGRDFFVVAGR